MRHPVTLDKLDKRGLISIFRAMTMDMSNQFDWNRIIKENGANNYLEVGRNNELRDQWEEVISKICYIGQPVTIS